MMSNVTFFLSMPRCRTAWLSLYLTGMGCYCFHELWRTATTIEQVVAAITEKGPGPVANADPSNWLFVEDLRRAFPQATFLEIVRTPAEVVQECLRAYGEADYTVMLQTYAKQRRETTLPRPWPQVIFESWTPEVSRQIVERAAPGLPWNQDWHDRLHQLYVQLSPARIAEDHQLARDGRLTYLTDHLVHEGGRTWA